MRCAEQLRTYSGARSSFARYIAASIILAFVVLGTPGTAAACSAPEEDFPFPAEDFETVIEWESVEVGWDRGERAAVFVPVRYWGDEPATPPESYLARSHANRSALAGPDDCTFLSRALYDEPGESRIRSVDGYKIEGGVEAIEHVHGEAVSLEINESEVDTLVVELEATPYFSALYWRGGWRWAGGLFAVAAVIFVGKRQGPWLRLPEGSDDPSSDNSAAI